METSLRSPPAEATSSGYRRLSLVLNEKAGALLATGKTPDLAAKLESGGGTARLVGAGPLPARLREAVADADAVVVAGGDGTIACAAEALAGTCIPLGILPGGTMNLLARDLGLPVADMEAAADVILAGHTTAIDTGRAGDQVFLCACMLGAPARLGRHREQARLDGPWRRWLKIGRAAMRILARPKSLRVILTVDGKAYRLRTPSLTITLNALDDVQGRYFARPRLDGGVLCAYAVQRHRLLDMARVFIRLALGHRKDRALLVLEGKTMRIGATSAALRVLVDGEERLLATPVTFTVAPRALRVFAPGGRLGDAV